MMRLILICLRILIFFSALTVVIVFSRRRAFSANQQLVYEISNGTFVPTFLAIHPDEYFGADRHFVFRTRSHFGDSLHVSGVDCSPGGRSLILWHQSLYRYDLAEDHLTRLLESQDANQKVIWSPDATQIAYIIAFGRAQARKIFIVDAQGLAKTEIVTPLQIPSSVAWSPDSTRIAYTYTTSANVKMQGMAIAEVASGAVTVIYEAARMNDVSWSPDGTRIAFDMSAGERTDIYTVHPDGTALTRLTSDAKSNILPRWSPDGSLISYSARGSKKYELYVMNPDGSDPYLVTRDIGGVDVLNRCWLMKAS